MTPASLAAPPAPVKPREMALSQHNFSLFYRLRRATGARRDITESRAMLASDIKDRFQRDGFDFPIDVMDSAAAAAYRARR